MKKIILLPFLFSIICLGISSCKKESGLGGRASVKGKLYSGNYHSPEVPVTKKMVSRKKEFIWFLVTGRMVMMMI